MIVTQTLNESLGVMPSGRVVRLTDGAMTKHLRESLKNSRAEEERRAEARKRLDLYHDRGRKHFELAVNSIFKNERVRAWRKEFIRFAEFQNVTKRIIREVSAVYSEPADRTISGAKEKYRQLQRDIRLDRRMRRANRMTNLLNNCLLWPTVANGQPKLRVVTTDQLWAVPHPNDPSLPVAWILDKPPGGVGTPQSTSPHYIVMDGQTFFWLDRDFRMVEGSRTEHGVGRVPALVTSREEMDDRILDAASGRDLVSAHEAVALVNTMLLKHQKSGTRLPYATGDLSTTATDQPMDEEHLLQIGEGVSLNTLNLGADPKSYIDVARAIIKQVAANYGIPESVFDLSYQATSGFEIELKRVGLREARRDQILDYRHFERDLADIMAAVLKAAGHEAAFNTNGWSIDFGEVETPQDPMQRLLWYEKAEKLGLVNRVEMYMEMNPELKEETAKKAVLGNLEMRIEMMRRFQSEAPTTFGPAESSNPPTDRDGGRLRVVGDDDEEVAE